MDLVALPWGLFGPISFVVFGLLLWRARVTARSSAALLAVGGVLFVVSRMERIDVLALISDGVLVLALIPIGWSMLSGRSPTRRREPAGLAPS